jgi:hypothetical protein
MELAMPRTDEVEPSVKQAGSAPTEHLLERVQIDRVRGRLRHEFQNRFDVGVIDLQIEVALEEFGDVPIRTYLPILVERHARSSLRQRAGTERPVQPPVGQPAGSETGDPGRWAKRLVPSQLARSAATS